MRRPATKPQLRRVSPSHFHSDHDLTSFGLHCTNPTRYQCTFYCMKHSSCLSLTSQIAIQTLHHEQYQHKTNMSEPILPIPRPPGHLFRVVKPFSKSSSITEVSLCLPHTLPSSFEPMTDINEDLSTRCASVSAAFGKMTGNARLRQQLPLLEYERLGDVLYQNIQENRVSSLRRRQIKMLPQLVVVKMSRDKERVRREVEAVEEIHRIGGEVATLHVGSYVLRSQHTEAPEMSYMVLRPIFGPTLEQFSERSSCWYMARSRRQTLC
jgi:hypothetical protein